MHMTLFCIGFVSAMLMASHASLANNNNCIKEIPIDAPLAHALDNAKEPAAILAGWRYFIKEFSSNSNVQLALWKWDGAIGSEPIKVADLIGDGYSVPVAISNNLYFRVGEQIWKSDGTTSGTLLLKTFDDNPDDGFREYNGEVYFAINSGGNDGGLWKTDATPGGTVMVTDIEPDDLSVVATIFNERLYFMGPADARQQFLWRTDGTARGTEKIALANGSPLIQHNNLLIFNGSSGLMQSNGTPEGTHAYDPTKDTALDAFYLNLVIAGVGKISPYIFYKNSLYYAHNHFRQSFLDPSHDFSHLWKIRSDNTGKVLVKEGTVIDHQTGQEETGVIINLWEYHDKIYYRVSGDHRGPPHNVTDRAALWQSDGTPEGTMQIYDASPFLSEIIPYGQSLYFYATGNFDIPMTTGWKKIKRRCE